MIRWTKEALSTSIRMTGNHRWIELLQKIVRRHNREFLPGQKKLRRSDVDETNWLEAVNASKKSKDSSLLFNISRASDLPPAAESVVWRYKVGDKVLLSRSADFSITGKVKKFEKPSVVGAFGDKVYTISHRDVHLSKDSHYVPVYFLKELHDGLDVCYQEELRPAIYAGESEMAMRRVRARRLLLAQKRKRLSVKRSQ
jgi:hypothetical protein